MELLRTRNFRLLAAFAVRLFCGVAALAVSPSIYSWWIAGATQPLAWATSSLVTVVGFGEYGLIHRLPVWPAYALPAVAVASVAVWYAKKREAIFWPRSLPPLTAMSLAFAPYSWPHDAAALITVQVGLVALMFADAHSRRAIVEIIVWLVLVEIACFATLAVFPNLAALFWFPPAMLAIWYRGIHLLSKAARDDGVGTKSLRATGGNFPWPQR